MSTPVLSASLEDYLEAIHHVVGEKGAARAKDIAARMDVRGASVTEALRALSHRGLVNYAPYDVVTLTIKGAEVARGTVRKHEVMRDFFGRVLGAGAAEADDMACKMEHALTQDMLDRLVAFIRRAHVAPPVKRRRGGISGSAPAKGRPCLKP